MSLDGMIVKIEIEHMRHAIQKRLMDHNEAISKMIDEAVSGFDLKREIELQVNVVLPIVLKETIKRSIESAMLRGEFRSQLDEMVREALVKSVAGVKSFDVGD